VTHKQQCHVSSGCRDCDLPSCGAVNRTFYSDSATLQTTATAVYPRAGRYTIRVQAADTAGGWSSQDVTLLVRKAGDSSGSAACCRSTGLIIAQQLGRPIDPTAFRPPWLGSRAAAVGWESGYLQGPEDLEAERLFDYTLLAPLETGELLCSRPSMLHSLPPPCKSQQCLCSTQCAASS
jgi:hypothetical protein